MTVWLLEAFNTDCRYRDDIRYRAYTTSQRKADLFKQIPKIQFSDSGHGIVFSAREHTGRRERSIYTLADYVRENMDAFKVATRS